MSILKRLFILFLAQCLPPQSFELFEAGAIFTADHVLDMQQIHRGYALELDRKQALTKCLYYTKADPKTAHERLSIRYSLLLLLATF